MSKPQPLDQRIAAALGAVGQAEVAAVLTEANTAADDARQRLEQLRAAALDPRLTDAQAQAKLQEAEAAEFSRQRLLTAAQKLNARLDELIESERQAEADRVAAEVKARRDAAVAQFDREYPVMANRIAGLVALLHEAGVRAPDVRLPVRWDGTRPDFAHYMPPPHLSVQPADYAPSCAGELVIKGGAK